MENDTQTLNAKVAIPRVNQPTQQAPTRKCNKRRGGRKMNKACTECRKRKVRCSRDTPKCTSCERHGLNCLYDLKRRDRLREALRRNEVLTALLEDISVRLDDEHRRQISTVIEDLDSQVPPISPSSASITASKRPKSHPPSSWANDGSSSLDYMEDETLRVQIPSGSGYIGSNSVVQWLQNLQEDIGQPQPDHLREPSRPSTSRIGAEDGESSVRHKRQVRTVDGGSITNYYFYLDGDSIDVETYDCRIVPSAETALELFGFFEKTVQTPFPILCKAFKGQLHTYYKNLRNGNNLIVCDKWKATLNLVCAIGSRYAYLTSANWQRNSDDHLIYMCRAVALLGIHHKVALVSVPDLPLIRATSLLSFYFLTIGHVSRAWHLIGISIRYAQATGMHLDSRDLSLSAERKRVTQQTWWSLLSIECIISSITGRPCIAMQEDYTGTSLGTVSTSSSIHPRTPNNERSHSISQPNNPGRGPADASIVDSQHLKPITSETKAVKLEPVNFIERHKGIDHILRRALAGLYSANRAHISWKKMRKRTAALMSTLQEWAEAANLPQIPLTTPNISLDMDRAQLLLTLYYLSVMITITRPFLRRADLRSRNQSQRTIEFNKSTAEMCVQAALSFTSLLPDTPDPRWLYENGPWWSSVHNFMQAMVVFLLELSVEATSLSLTRRSDLSNGILKLSSWLQSMAVKDAISRRAYTIMYKVLKDYGHAIPSSPFEDDAEDAMQQDNADSPIDSNMTDSMLDDMTDFTQTPNVARNEAEKQSAPTLWPYDWPDDVYNPDSRPHDDDSYSELSPSTIADQSYLGSSDYQISSVFEPFVTNFTDDGVMPLDLPRFGVMRH